MKKRPRKLEAFIMDILRVCKKHKHGFKFDSLDVVPEMTPKFIQQLQQLTYHPDVATDDGTDEISANVDKSGRPKFKFYDEE